MSVHCLWRCYPVNRTGRDSNVWLCLGRQEIFVCGPVSRRRWGVVGGWKPEKWWEGKKKQRKEEELGFKFSGGQDTQHSPFVMAPHSLFCCSPSELCGHGCREESFLLVCGPLRSKQPAGSSVQSDSLEKVGEFCMCETSQQRWD